MDMNNKQNNMNCAEKKTRVRGENWSQEEKDMFIEVMRDASSVVESKECDTNTNIEKNLEWAKIQKKLTELSGIHRDIPQIKNFWRRTKVPTKKVSEHRRSVHDTDGDQKPSPDNTSKAAVIEDWIKSENRSRNRRVKECAIALMKEEYSLKLQFQQQEITHQKLRQTLEIELLYLEKEKKLLQIELIKKNLKNYY